MTTELLGPPLTVTAADPGVTTIDEKEIDDPVNGTPITYIVVYEENPVRVPTETSKEEMRAVQPELVVAILAESKAMGDMLDTSPEFNPKWEVFPRPSSP